MQFSIPAWLSSTVAIIIALGGAFALVAYAWAQKSGGTTRALNESNEALRDLLKDKEQEWNHKWEEVQRQLLENAQQIGKLQGQVEKLEKRNGHLESLVVQSLTIYWKDNPAAASEIQEEIAANGTSPTK